jgi:nicotinate-nucleotide adenylyltransferase
MYRIGVMGGTFDPIHLGHLAVAEEAHQLLGLSEVRFMPAGHPYFKEAAAISPSADRVNMVNLAIGGKPYFKISLLEVQRSGPSYAVDSMDKTKKQLGTGDELFFIMGWDSLMTLHLWFEAARLIRICRIVAAPRPGYPRPDVNLLEKDLPGISERTVVMDRPLVDISATSIRQSVRQGLPIDGMVPGEVAKYIREKGLYQGVAQNSKLKGQNHNSKVKSTAPPNPP